MESQIVIIGISFVSRKSFICRRQDYIRPIQRPEHHSALKSFMVIIVVMVLLSAKYIKPFMLNRFICLFSSDQSISRIRGTVIWLVPGKVMLHNDFQITN